MFSLVVVNHSFRFEVGLGRIAYPSIVIAALTLLDNL